MVNLEDGQDADVIVRKGQTSIAFTRYAVFSMQGEMHVYYYVIGFFDYGVKNYSFSLKETKSNKRGHIGDIYFLTNRCLSLPGLVFLLVISKKKISTHSLV